MTVFVTVCAFGFYPLLELYMHAIYKCILASAEVWFPMFICAVQDGACKQSSGQLPPNLREYVIAACEGVMFGRFSKLAGRNQLSATDVALAARYAAEFPDRRSYLLLMAIREADKPAYDRLEANLKAKILTSTLATARWYNDWGLLGDSAFDGESAKALIETGESASALLRPLLDDRTRALLFGSEASTESRLKQYRRCDFAYRYLAIIENRTPAFHVNPEQRDKDIALLIRELSDPNHIGGLRR